MQKARGHHRQNRYGQAIRYYEEVLKIKPMHFEATFNLAAAHIAASSMPKPIRCSKKQSIFSPTMPKSS